MQQPYLHQLEFKKLKNIEDAIVSFEGHRITGVFGVNGSGKSTLLHALLCLYKPSDRDIDRINYKFSNFFTPTTQATWAGSEIIAKLSYRQQQHVNTKFQPYTKVSDRWSPKYDRRPSRDVYYLGIETCVPDIEKETYSSKIHFDSENLTDQESEQIRKVTSYILNKDISEYHLHKRGTKKYFGFRENDISYSSLYMGAGEQRVIRLISILVKCPKYSLIVIDELDLTLHTIALNRIIEKMIELAELKNLQIVFTSHREELLKRADINVRHLHQTSKGTLIFNNTTLDCITRLNGQIQTAIEIFVEDVVSQQIISKLIEEKNVNRYCKIKTFGAIENAFSLLAGLHFKGDDLERTLIITDGDRYQTIEDKHTQLKKHLTGNEQGKDELRISLLSNIRQYALSEGCNPEKYIVLALKNLDDGTEICEMSKCINFVEDDHDYVFDLIKLLNYDYVLGLYRVIEKFSECEEYSVMVKSIAGWIDIKIKDLKLN